MKPLNGFIISIFLLLLITPFSSRAQDRNCRKVDVTVEVTHSSGGQGGSIRVSPKDSGLKFMLHLLSDNGENEQVKIKSGTVNNIPPGTYSLIIHYPNGRYCTETRKVTVN